MERGAAKAIPAGRDRRQSQALVGLVGVALALETVGTLRSALAQVRPFPAYVAGTIGISLAFTGLVRLVRASTTAGALAGGMICLVVTYRTGWFSEPVERSALTPLACLFALTFLATRAGREHKVRAGLAEKRSGRSAAQVIANLGVTALCVSPFAEWILRRSAAGHCRPDFADLWVMAAVKTACLAALVEATADTMSSELGQAFGGRPVLLAGLRRVEAGTDGAISLLGTATGVAGGTLVAGAGAWAMHLDGHAGLVSLGCGTLGLFADSVIGATLERWGWVGNDLVNFSGTAFAAAVAAALMRA